MGMFSSISNNAMLALNNGQAVAGRPNISMGSPGGMDEDVQAELQQALQSGIPGKMPGQIPQQQFLQNLPMMMPGSGMAAAMPQVNQQLLQQPPGLPTGSSPGGKSQQSMSSPIMQQGIIPEQPNVGIGSPGAISDPGQFQGGLRPAPSNYRPPSSLMRPGGIMRRRTGR
jgi:hypothetical protein